MTLDYQSTSASKEPNRVVLIFASFFSACVIGISVGLFTVGFVGLVKDAEMWRVSGRADLESLSLALFSYQSVLLFGGMAVLIFIRRLFKVPRWHGPADVIYAAHSDISFLSIKTGGATIVSVFTSVLAGGSVGVYGPLVHLGALLSRLFHTAFRSTLFSQNMLIGCGVAAAISAGFNAPIAGMIFAHEVVLRHFSMRALAPIAIASIASFSVSSWIFEDARWLYLDIDVPSILPLSPGLLLAGLFFGLIAVIIIRAQIGVSGWAAKSGLSDWMLGGIAVSVCSIVGFFVPESLGLGLVAIRDMLNLEFGLWALLILLITKIFLTAISTCLGFSLGIFSPALFSGAAAGGVVAYCVGLFGLPVSVPIFMVCGMAALSGAVTGAPIAVMVIIIEMTMSYELAVSTMIAVGTCSLITFSFGGHSLFDQQLLMRNINISGGRVALRLSEMKIDILAGKKYASVPEGITVESAAQILATNGYSEGYCLTASGELIGKINLQDLVRVPTGTLIESVLDKKPVQLISGTSVGQAIETAADFVGEAMPVISETTGALIGVVSEADIFTAVLETQKLVTSLEKT